MFKSVRYVLKENFSNLYRIYSIAKYELLADWRDSRLGLFWNFANPAIQILTYWFVFGILRGRNAVDNIPFVEWMLGGMGVWFFMSPCITNGCNAIFSKTRVITKMKFPVSVLPATVVLKELFNHICIMAMIILFYFVRGNVTFSWQWLELFYYCFCACIFAISFAMITSVLNMLARDTRKLIMACMRLLLYLTPILWPITDLERFSHNLALLVKCNPIYYVVCGYRDCFFYHKGLLAYRKQMFVFWVITIVLFVIGSMLMYKFKHKFIDMI